MGSKYEKSNQKGWFIEFNKQLIINAITMAFKQNSKTVNTDLIEKNCTNRKFRCKSFIRRGNTRYSCKNLWLLQKRYCYGLSKL